MRVEEDARLRRAVGCQLGLDSLHLLFAEGDEGFRLFAMAGDGPEKTQAGFEIFQRLVEEVDDRDGNACSRLDLRDLFR